VGSDLPVQREEVETAATLVRMAPTHVRFGTFEVFYYRQQHEHLRTLADYVIEHHFPELAGAPDRYPRFLTEVATRTARLMAQWQTVGFAHGVMNTDNMSILGLTIDYGPFGFMDDYDPGFIPNHTDVSGRYAFDQQPGVGMWNVGRLAQAMIPLMSLEEAQAALDAYEPAFIDRYAELLRAKLGLWEVRDTDVALIGELFGLLHANHADFTRFFRALGSFKQDPADVNAPIRDLFMDWAAWNAWADRYRGRLEAEGSVDAERRGRMDAVNPKYILRNYLAQNAITRATEHRDYSEIDRLLALLRNPYDEQPEMEEYAAPPPDWGKRLVVSCSS
jgi:uncharacterized protein YdiU (UPF0061 family)